jgi:hypothetical protein
VSLRPEPDGVSADDAPPDPDAIRRKLVEAIAAKGVEAFSSHQAVEALDDYRITSPKQLVDALRPRGIASKDIRIGDRHLRGYSLAMLVNFDNATPATDPRDNGKGRTCGIVENKGVSPQNEKIVHTSEKGGVDTSPEPRPPPFSADDTEADYDEAARYGWKNLE